MPFGYEAGPQIVYSSDVKIVDNGSLIFEQLRLAHRYRNRLCEIERDRRENVDMALRNLRPELMKLTNDLDEINSNIEKLSDEIKSNRVRKRTKDAATKEQSKQLKELRAKRRELYSAVREKRAEAFDSDDVKCALKKTDADDLVARKQARATCGCYWGTYAVVEQGCSKFRKGRPPRFSPWKGEGKLAIQLQGGLSVPDAFGDDTRLQISEHPSEGGHLYNFRFRIGSDNRKPIFATLRGRMRELPSDAKIKWVYLVARRIATHTKWSLQFVLERDSGWDKPSGEGVVAVNLGWRKIDDNMRVAYWVGDDGRSGELSLPMDLLQRLRKCESLQSIRDIHFDGVKLLVATMKQGGELPDWVVTHNNWLDREILKPMRDSVYRVVSAEKKAFDDIISNWDGKNVDFPDWLVEDTSRIMTWRSQSRLASVILRWRENRFDGDTILYNVLEAWRKRDKHLYEWQENNRCRFQRIRRAIYLNFSADLRLNYKYLAISKIDWRTFQMVPNIEDGDDEERQRERKRFASPSILNNALTNSFGSDVRWYNAKNMTSQCSVCGNITNADHVNIIIQCNNCMSSWDQDRNHCQNLLNVNKDTECVPAR